MRRLILLMALAAPAAAGLFAQVAGVPEADRLLFANGLARRKLWNEAVSEYSALTNAVSVGRDEVYFRLAEAERHAGSKDAARKHYAMAYEASPEGKWSAIARFNEALLSKTDSRKALLQSIDRASAPKDIRQAALYNLACDEEREGDLASARATFGKAAKVDRSTETARISLLRQAAILSADKNKDMHASAAAVFAQLADAPERAVAEEAIYLSAMMNYRDGVWSEAATLFRTLAEKFPDGARAKESALWAAWADYRAMRYAEAHRSAESIGPASEDAAYLKAAALLKMGRFDDSLQAATESLERFPNGKFAEILAVQRVELYARKGDGAGVLKAISERGDWPEKSSAAVYAFGCDAAFAQGEWQLAVTYAREVYTRATGDTAARAGYLEGLAFMKLGDAPAARRSWSAVLAAHPDSQWSSRALEARAMEELKAGEHKAAARSLEELQRRFPERGGSAQNLYWRGVALRGAGDAPGAEAALNDCLKANPVSDYAREAKLELALLMQQRDDFAAAAPLIFELVGSATEGRIPIEALVRQAEKDLEAGRADEALKAAKSALSRDGADDKWLQAAAAIAGEAHSARGERDASEAAFRKAVKYPVKTAYGARASLSLGRLLLSAGNTDEATQVLEQTVERTSSPELLRLRMDAYVALGACARAKGDTEGELGYTMIVATLFDDPQAVTAALTRAAELLRSSGRPEEADKLLEERKARYGE